MKLSNLILVGALEVGGSVASAGCVEPKSQVSLDQADAKVEQCKNSAEVQNCVRHAVQLSTAESVTASTAAMNKCYEIMEKCTEFPVMGATLDDNQRKKK